MNEQLLTITLLVVNVCALGVLYLYFMQRRATQRIEDYLRNPYRTSRVEDKIDRVLRRIGQVKTRLTDDEKDDQKAKRQARQGVRA